MTEKKEPENAKVVLDGETLERAISRLPVRQRVHVEQSADFLSLVYGWKRVQALDLLARVGMILSNGKHQDDAG
jgi:hypothetical protein